MSRYLGPRLRIIRRIGKLRGFTRKKPSKRRFFVQGRVKWRVIPPGQHGLAKLFKTRMSNYADSEYLIRLKVKQRLRFHYGLTEKQLINYVRKAKSKKDSTGQVLLQLLEMRLDNVVFRLNMAPTIPAARQLVSHRHILVNNKKVNIPSYMCKIKDVISVAMKKKSFFLVKNNLLNKYSKNKKINFHKKYLEKTLFFILLKCKVVPNVSTAMQLIKKGNVYVNKQPIYNFKYVCNFRDTIKISTPQGSKTIKLKYYFPSSKKLNK